VRQDTGQYLNANGTWQTAPTAALTTTTSLVTDGHLGIGRGAAYSGAVAVDDFTVFKQEVHETFDTTAVGTRPAGWLGWSTDSNSAFKVGTTRALSAPNGFTSSGGSTSTARGWADTMFPQDVNASAALYLDSLVPAQVFVRGLNLDTSAPTYYALSVTRGLNAHLVKVVHGQTTVLASIKSASYFSSQWLRAQVIAEGDRLRAVLFRLDTRQWLTPDGTWSGSPDFALEVRDGSITGPGRAGVGRLASFSGPVTFDDFDAQPADAASGPVIDVKQIDGTNPITGEVTFRATVSKPVVRVEFRLNGQLRGVSTTAPADWTFDSTTVVNGTHTLTVRAFDAAGNFGSTDLSITIDNEDSDPLDRPDIPRHYSHIRVAQLAYSGTPMGDFEKNLLRNSVDLVIPNPQYLSTINATSPDTPQLIYSNVSNLYQGLLTDWLTFADRTGASRELAFYHVTKATPFTGVSSSSQPVNWFWGVYQSNGTSPPTDVTSAARGGRNFNVSFGGTGQWTAIGYTDRFREMNVTLVTPAAPGWGGVWEYASAVDAAGNPTAWATLPLVQDGTAGLRQSGAITFDPPADWKAASVGGSSRLFYVRFRVTSGDATQDPELKTVFGRDYVAANGGHSGMIPAFDYAADRDGDGYLNDAEYATRAAGLNARFVYESRLFYPFYGQMRFVTNPSSSAMRKWAGEYHVRLLESTPLADGIFMDNATGNVPFQGVSVVEPTATFGLDSGSLILAVSRAIQPHWVLSNTSGGLNTADPITAGSAGVFEEFLIRPLAANWSEVGDAANLIARRLNSPNEPYVVVDSHPQGGSMTDSRTQIATLAYYYLVADPERSMLMFYGGFAPSSSWTQHWVPAAAVNVGKPTGAMQTLATGTDPANAALTYKVYSRQYENALVLYKPLSYATGKPEGTTGANTTTIHQLGGRYRQVYANGTFGPIQTAVALKNGEGMVLMKA
jgi:hypothetical protein